jgi:hypothetical protein
MIDFKFSGVAGAAVANAAVMPWPLHAAASAAATARPAVAVHGAVPAIKHRAAAPVASVNRGTI